MIDKKNDPPGDPGAGEKDVNDFSDLNATALELEFPDSIVHTFEEIAQVQAAFHGPEQDPKSEFTRADLQLALTRCAVSLQAIYPELSNIEGGVRELDAIVKTLAEMHKTSVFLPTGQHRIRIASQKIKSLTNLLASDMALILAVQMISLGMTESNPQWELVKYILSGKSKSKK